MKLGEIPTSRKIREKWGTQIQAPPAPIYMQRTRTIRTEGAT